MKNLHTSNLSAARPSGFTLLELMFALAVAAILIGIAAPNMRSFILNNRLTSTAGSMLRSIQTARAEAVKRQQNVVICTSANPTSPSPTCSKTGISGWIIFQDTNGNWDVDTGESVIGSQSFESNKMYLLADQDMRLSFNAKGFANPAGTKIPSTAMVMCDSRGNQTVSGQSTARGFWILNTGRARITRVTSDIVTLLNASHINSNCPP